MDFQEGCRYTLFARICQGLGQWSFQRILVCSLLLAFFFRLYGLYSVKILNNDTIYYLGLLDHFVRNGLLGGLEKISQTRAAPLYPLLLYGIHQVVKDSTLSAVSLSFVAGILAVIPFLIQAKGLFGRREAWVGGLLFATNSYLVRYSVWVVREMPALLFFLSALVVLGKSRPGRATRRLMGALAGFSACLIRPEYTVIWLGGVVLYLLLSRRWAHLLVLLCTWWILILCIHLGRSLPVVGVFDQILIGRVLSPIFLRGRELVLSDGIWLCLRIAGDLAKSLVQMGALMGPVAAVFSVAGFWSRLRRWDEVSTSEKMTLSLICSAFLVYSVWGTVGGYFTKRFMVLPSCLLLLFSARGVAALADKSGKNGARVAALSLFIMFVSNVAYTLGHQVGERRVGLKYAGQYISRNWEGAARARVVTDEPMVAYYAGGVSVKPSATSAPAALERLARCGRADYLVLKEDKVSGPEAGISRLARKGNLKCEARIPYGARDGRERVVAVYRVVCVKAEAGRDGRE